MKKLLPLIFLFGFQFTEAQIEVEYHFYSECQRRIIKDSLEFNLQNLVTNKSYFPEDSKVIIPYIGKYELSVTIKNGKFIRSYEEEVEFRDSQKVIDTLTVPKILFEFENDNKTDNSKYLNCENLCNGYEVDYFENGKKRFEGNFSDGKAIWETEFERDGSFVKYYYDKLNRYKRFEYYDLNGNLIEYLINKYRKKNFIQKTYNPKGKLIKREVQIYYPVRKK